MRLFILVMAMLFFGCGKEYVVEKPVPIEPPLPGPGPGGDPISYAEMQSKLNQFCVSCHATANFMQNETSLRQSAVRARLLNRTMPPSSSNIVVPETDRSAMINFF